jgi:hypothetical protein
MANQPTEAVIAGSKSFALALLAPLTERVGIRPRIAADPSQAVELMGGKGLVVVEFLGDRSIDAIRKLRDRASGLAVIAAVPEGHAEAEEVLRSIGVESARWDGKPESVLAAVSRRLAAAPSAAPRAGPVRPDAEAATAAMPPTEAAPPAGTFFDDVPLDEVSEPPQPTQAAVPAPPVPTPAAACGAWPANVPGAVEAADALAQGLQGHFAPAGSPLAVIAEAMTAMSPLERAVLLGEMQAVDVGPIRKAAVMRVRVAIALATAPQAPGEGPADPAAVSALLAEIDGLLSEVNALVAAAPAELQPPLEQVRNALVKEAIDFSEAAHRGEPSEAPAEAPPGITSASARKAAQARVVTIDSKAETEIAAAERSRRRRMVAVVAAAALAAGSYHVYTFMEGRRVEPANSVRGLTNAFASDTAQGGRVIHTSGGVAFDPAELRRFVDDEALKGNVVLDMGGGNLLVQPRSTLPGAAVPRPAAQAPPAASGGSGDSRAGSN